MSFISHKAEQKKFMVSVIKLPIFHSNPESFFFCSQIVLFAVWFVDAWHSDKKSQVSILTNTGKHFFQTNMLLPARVLATFARKRSQKQKFQYNNSKKKNFYLLFCQYHNVWIILF